MHSTPSRAARKRVALAAFTGLWLSACGGGGGGDATPVAAAPTPAEAPTAAGPSPSVNGPAVPAPSGSSAPVAQGPAAPAAGGTPAPAPAASGTPAPAPAPAPATAVSLAQTGELWLTTSHAGQVQRYPGTARLPDGTYVAVRDDSIERRAETSVLLRRLDTQGNPVGVETTIAAGSRPGVTAFPDGSFLVTWLMPPPPTFTLEFFVAGQLFDAAGAPVGGVMSLGSASNSAQPTALVDGTFILTEFVVDSHVNGAGAVLRGFRRDGTSTGFVAQLRDDACGVSGRPSATALPAGGFAVAWPYTCGSAAPHVRMRVYDGNGTLAGSSEMTVGSVGDGMGVDSATLTSGNIVLAWSLGTIQLREVRTLVVDPAALPTSSDASRRVSPQGRTPLPVKALAGGGFVIPWFTVSENDAQAPVNRFTNAGEPL
ncbi:hypothetical protein ACPWT1_20275 [Ramlibacter sp. MMS24-I3-19]|uniref:hypothetical protein n=1 Tax=Ramlibacter sp. MMS24-I3-19 TaxID=3416606 RepID=UPI003D054612